MNFFFALRLTIFNHIMVKYYSEMINVSIAKPQHRILATLFDLAILYAVILLLMVRTIIAVIEIDFSQENINVWPLFISSLLTGGIVLIFFCVYYLVIPVFFKGQTLGKRFFKIKIVKANGDNIDLQTLFIREVIGTALLFIMSLGVSILVEFIVLLTNKQKQTFHDVLASTQVIDVE